MSLTTVFVVSDAGASSPCSGKIFGVFLDEAKAGELEKDINASPRSWDLYGVNGLEGQVYADPLSLDEIPKSDEATPILPKPESGSTVYLVTDIGVTRPCMGLLFGVFRDRSKAEELQIRVEANAEKWGLWDTDDTVRIYPCKLDEVRYKKN